MSAVQSVLFPTLIVAFLELLSVHQAHGKYIQGTINTQQSREDWVFLDRFCFLSNKGYLRFKFQFPRSFEPQNVLLYYDEPDQWPAVYPSDLSCLEREAVLNIDNYQVINLTRTHDAHWSGCELDAVDNITRCEGGRSFRSVRERWWFIAVSKCGAREGLNLDYEIWMTNSDDGDIFFEHFSADEFYIFQTDIGFLCYMSVILCLSLWVTNILQTDIAFLVIFLVMLVTSIACGVVLRGRQLFHTTYKLYMVSLALEFLYLFLMCIALGKYANDGVENRGLETFARIFESCSTLVFLLLLILMGKGYTITRGRLSTSGSIKIAIFMTLYCITYGVLFIYEANFFDPGEVLYLYESPPGYGLISMRLIGWIWFCYAIFFTLKHYPEKGSFYYPFFIFYTIWFLAMPVVIILAFFALDKWVRAKVVNGITLAITFGAHVYFLILTRPTAANKNFPYHVRTSQIGIMNTPTQNGAPDGASQNTDSFGTHAYAPQDMPPSYYDATAGPNFSELFTVSNTRGKDEGASYGAQTTGELKLQPDGTFHVPLTPSVEQ